MGCFARVSPWVLALLVIAPAGAEEEEAQSAIVWCKNLPSAFAEAKAVQKVLMVCVNAKHVAGRTDEEPAAKGLREVIYKDPRVVAKSRAFVCALLTREGSSKDYGELRALEVDGDLVSPQHIFIHPDGTKILLREEYWSHGTGEPGIEALLTLMERASQKLAVDIAKHKPAPAQDPADAPDEGEARAAWIARIVMQVVKGSAADHEAAIEALIENDQAGDCVHPLVALCAEHRKNTALIIAIVRALGRDGLESAAAPVAGLLKHRDLPVRGHVAVTLEYIGSRDKRVVGALKKAVDKEKDDAIANHMYRALGRCGVTDTKARALLLKKAESAKSEFASYGPCIGLAYFQGDEKAARGVEKMLKKIGVPGGRRGGGQNTVKRALLSWTLAAIGDKKSGDFVEKELVARLENMKDFWVEGLRSFWNGVAAKCDGDESAMAGIEQGVRFTVGFAKRLDLGRYGAETRNLMDEYRKGRNNSTFRPLGENLLDTGE